MTDTKKKPIQKKEKKVSRLEKCKEELKNTEDKFKRALADYQNLVKRSAEEKQEFAKFANEMLLTELIPVYDNLKISLQFSDEKNHKAWLKGVEYVQKQFLTALNNSGVKEIKTVGENFDPQTMEALDGEGEKVVKEVKPGYKLNGKLIIPAKVSLANK